MAFPSSGRMKNYSLPWSGIFLKKAAVAIFIVPMYIQHRTPRYTSLVPRPLPDFISQPWRKIGRRPGIKTMSQTRNGGLG